MRRVAVLACALAFSACASLNPPLETPAGTTPAYRFDDVAKSGDADRTFLIASFSGGGTRAAAFAYGVLEELRDTDLGGGRSLLDELDLVSSVSGGSFASAYYALHGRERFFAEFREQVLYRKLELGLALRVLAPWNWPLLASPWYTRSDLAAAYYGASLFGGATYQALVDRPQRPFVVLNATDLSAGAQVSFTQEHFDRLCSSLSDVPIGRAVAASSAFPIAFAPLTFANYPKPGCGYLTPDWVELAQRDLDVAPQRWALARSWREYEDAERRPYLHLSDGGISDNIGLRVVESSILTGGGFSPDLYGKISRGEIRRLAIIVVDAKPRDEPSADASARAPGVFSVLGAAATVPLENYSEDTVALIRAWAREFELAAADFGAIRARCDARPTEPERVRCRTEMGVRDEDRPPDPQLFLMHVRFDAIEDAELRARLESVRTRLQLPRPQVDELVTAARKVLRESPQFAPFVEAVRQAASNP